MSAQSVSMDDSAVLECKAWKIPGEPLVFSLYWGVEEARFQYQQRKGTTATTCWNVGEGLPS